MAECLIGADVGGTSTRVAVATLSGRVLGAAQAGAGNPNAVGLTTSAEQIRSATENALRQAQEAQGAALADRPLVPRSFTIGLAGYRTAIAAGEDFLQACVPDQFGLRPRIVSDLGVAFASATPLTGGYVLIAGTGSAAAEIEGGEIVARRGGWGWLLGDEGAGFWLGREAVRHALTEVERAGVRGPLTRRVLDRLGQAAPGDDAFEVLLRRPYAADPVKLGELAPIVTELVDQDPAAVTITARAADLLTRLLLELQPRPGLPIVTTGSVLQPGGPIHRLFSDRVSTATGAPVLRAASGLVGALWLAAGTGPDGSARTDPSDPAIHERLLATLPLS